MSTTPTSGGWSLLASYTIVVFTAGMLLGILFGDCTWRWLHGVGSCG